MLLPNFQVLSATNYSWKTTFESFLIGYNLLGYIDGKNPCPTDKDFLQINLYYLGAIRQINTP